MREALIRKGRMMSKDPVCGMDVDERDAMKKGNTAEFGGQAENGPLPGGVNCVAGQGPGKAHPQRKRRWRGWFARWRGAHFTPF